MFVIEFLLNIAGATVLLLFAFRWCKEELNSPTDHHYGKSSRSQATVSATIWCLIGCSDAVLHGSGNNGFRLASSSMIPELYAAMLGADLGSALVILFLSLDIRWLAPLMLLVGGLLFLKSETATLKQIGRIIMGVGLILIALGLIRANVSPLRDSSFLPDLTLLLERDFLATFLIGAILAFLLHSSVAAVLMFVAFVDSETLSLMVGVSLVLGANLGSSLLPIWITTMPPGDNSTRPTYPGGAANMVVIVNRTPLIGLLLKSIRASKLSSHIIFNAMLLIAIPFGRLAGICAERLLPEHKSSNEDMLTHYRSVWTKRLYVLPHSQWHASSVKFKTCF